MKSGESRGLAPKQARFVAEYLVDLNATQAAIRAGYSKRTANEQGARLLAKASVAAAVRAAEGQRRAETALRADEARRINACIARIDPAEMLDAEGRLLPIAEMPRHVRLAIRSVKVRRNAEGEADTLEVQFWDKPRAVEMEYRHFGLLVDRVQVSGDLELVASRLVAARKRLAAAKGGES